MSWLSAWLPRALSVSRIFEASIIFVRLYLYDHRVQVPKQRCSHAAGVPPWVLV